MSRTIKSLKGILADQGSNAVSILLVFVATPILIRQLGNSDYGFWMTVMQLLGYIGLVDPGLGVQVTRAIAGSEDRERLRRFLATAFYAQLCIAILFLVAGFCLGLVLNRFVALPVVAKTAYAVCYALAVVVGTGGVITAYFLAVLAGHQRLVASSILGSVQQVFGLGAGTFFVWLGAGLWALPIAYLVAGTSSLVV
jgi:O-antigen/teichoic acid export membrane protein